MMEHHHRYTVMPEGHTHSMRCLWTIAHAVSGLRDDARMLRRCAVQTNRSEELIELVLPVLPAVRYAHHIRTCTVHVGSSW